MIKPRIYLCVYPSGLKFWRVKPDRPGPWKRPRSGRAGSYWGKAYNFVYDLNRGIK